VVRRKPLGRARHLARQFAPTAIPLASIAFEYNADLRFRRLRDAALDAARERRRRPSRPRMRALSVAVGGRIEWRDVPAPPPPGPAGATVHPVAVATCDLDRALALGATPFLLPLHFGHECVAEVMAVGEQVHSVRPGELVVVPFQISCGGCAACRTGRTANCSSVPPISMYGFGLAGGHWGGAVSDQLAVPYADAMLVPLPAGIEPAAAASVADNVSDGYRHIAPYADAVRGREEEVQVLILVARDRDTMFSASVPLYAGLVAKVLGLERVLLVDARAAVRDHAQRLGISAISPSRLDRRLRAPLVVDASATARGARLAVAHTAQDGICTSVGALHAHARLPAALMYGRNIAYHLARTHARRIIPEVLGLMIDGGLHPELVTTQLAPLDDAPRAITSHVVGDITKTVLVE
jgi:alcohol dehydrogenase